MKRKLHFHIDLPPYNTDLLCTFGMNAGEIKRLLYKYNTLVGREIEGIEEMPVYSAATTWQFDNGGLLIQFKGIPKTIAELGTLQHEIFHAVTMLFDRKGIRLKVHTSCEAYAYMIDFVTVEVYRRLRVIAFKK